MKSPYRRRGTSIEKRFVRTSTLATFVVVTIVPDQVCPRRTSLVEKCIPKIRGGAWFAATAGAGSTVLLPNVTFAGMAVDCAEQPASKSAASARATGPDIGELTERRTSAFPAARKAAAAPGS